MKYTVIFASGYTDDLESLNRDLRGDILINDDNGNFYNPFFMTIERIKAEFTSDKVCYLENNLVLLHSVTKENILGAVPQIYEWMFYKRWVPLSEEQLQTFFYPREDWVAFEIDVLANE